MFFNRISRAALACTVVLGVGFIPTTGFSQVEFRVGPDGLRIDRDCNPRYEECYDNRRRGDDSRRGDDRARCSEGRALSKAERMGIRRARVVDAGRRSIEVSGRDRRGERIRVTFGRQASCPVLR